MSAARPPEGARTATRQDEGSPMGTETTQPAGKRPPRQSRTGLTSTGARKAASKSDRSRAREFALQALYQHLVGGNDAAAIDAFTRDLAGFHKADSAHYDALLHGCIGEATELDALILPLLDRKMAEISPIEHGVMWIGVYEFRHCADVPWRVVLNECIELAKEFGGTDGHKYVNGVLNGLAPKLRAAEVEADRASGKARP
jgi:N utilization substance protein B